MSFVTSVYPMSFDDDEEYTYETEKRTHWVVDEQGTVHLFLDSGEQIATHMYGSFEAISCEEADDND